MNIDDSSLDFGAEDRTASNKSKLPHPMTCMAHLGFRTSAFVVFLFCDIFNSGFISAFICILLLLCVDFWVVKNITGRLLVGLRWWNKITEAGENKWIYEARPSNSPIKNNAFETKVFWLGLIIFPILWFLMLFSTLFGLHITWLPCVAVALALSGANLFGYLRCKFSSRKDFTGAATSYFAGKMFSMAASQPAKEGDENTLFAAK